MAKRKIKLYNYWACDSENPTNRTLKAKYNSYSWQGCNLLSAKLLQRFRFFDFLDDILEDKRVNQNANDFHHKHTSEKTVLYFHNGGKWDFDFLIKELIQKGFEQEQTKKPSLNHFAILKDASVCYSVTFNYNDNIILCIDSLKKLTKSISALGKQFNLPKLEKDYELTAAKLNCYINEDYNNPLIKQDVEYDLRDVIILQKAMNWFISQGGHPVKVSVAGDAFSDPCFNSKRWDMYQLTENEWLQAFQIYYGGYTAFYQPNQDKWNYSKNGIFHYDLNSSYPALMNGDLPLPARAPRPGWYSKGYNACVINIKSAKVKPGMFAIIPSMSRVLDAPYANKQWKDNQTGYVNEVKNYRIAVWYYELKYWEKFYDMEYTIETKWHYSAYYNKGIARFYQTNYQAKSEAKTEAERQYAKLRLNAPTGKFGQKPWREIVVYSKEKPVVENYTFNEPREDRFSIGEVKQWIGQQVQAENFGYIPIIAWVTMRARCKLFDVMLAVHNKYGEGVCLYFDTDSVFSTKDISDLIPVDNKKMGYWKQEADSGKAHYFKYLCCKNYCSLDKDKQIVNMATSGWKFNPEIHLKDIYNDYYCGMEIPNATLSKATCEGTPLLKLVAKRIGSKTTPKPLSTFNA